MQKNYFSIFIHFLFQTIFFIIFAVPKYGYYIQTACKANELLAQGNTLGHYEYGVKNALKRQKHYGYN